MASSTPRKVGYVRLGNSGLKVSKIILGTMQYGSKGWQPWLIEDQDEVARHIKYAYDAGIQTFDTANLYSNGLSEIMLGNAIKKLQLPRDEIVVMTKLYMPVARAYDTYDVISGEVADQLGYINQHGLSRKHIFESVKHSLERLQLEYIDVFQCHRFDAYTPIEETMQALHDVVQAGYVRYIGMSSCHAWQFHVMQNYALTHGLTPFISMQNHYNMLYREEEREMFPTLKHFGVGAIPWSPLARGLLARPLAADRSERAETDDFIVQYNKGAGTADIITRVQEIARRKDISMAQVAVAWMLSRPGVSAPIVGTTSLKHLADIIGGVDVTLTPEEIAYLGDPYRPMEIVGHSEWDGNTKPLG
ncbi:hypothetical protein PLICRDRAFT_656357 [Plicaturopsis crispa FD-325 SS-3]|nr:hypothetical protein PLICRDRAFT_656357 [Plicaturopsis crispa FD-325 SS-3]